MTRMFAALGLALVAASTAGAAEIKVVRPGGRTALVTVVGPIVTGDAARFASAVNGLEGAMVVLNGGDGDPREGEFLGAEAGSRGFGTYVGAKAHCSGACAIAWLGGGRRYIERGARVVLAPGASDAYLRAAALPDDAVTYVRGAPPDGSRSIDIPQATRLGIPVVDAGGGGG